MSRLQDLQYRPEWALRMIDRRCDLNLSQSEVAARAGVSATTVSIVEKGFGSEESVKRVAAVVGLDVDSAARDREAWVRERKEAHARVTAEVRAHIVRRANVLLAEANEAAFAMLKRINRERAEEYRKLAQDYRDQDVLMYDTRSPEVNARPARGKPSNGKRGLRLIQGGAA